MPMHAHQKGQVMVLTSIVIGGLVLSASVIAGLLMFFQLQQSNDAVTSGMALAAADAGVEQALSYYYHGITTINSFPEDPVTPVGPVSGTLPNGATYTASLWCVKSDKIETVSCRDNDNVYGFKIRSTGTSQKTERILETFYATRFSG